MQRAEDLLQRGFPSSFLLLLPLLRPGAALHGEPSHEPGSPVARVTRSPHHEPGSLGARITSPCHQTSTHQKQMPLNYQRSGQKNQQRLTSMFRQTRKYGQLRGPYLNQQHCAALHCTALHCTALYYTALHFTSSINITITFTSLSHELGPSGPSWSSSRNVCLFV